MNDKFILDVCCGGRTFWFNKKHDTYYDKEKDIWLEKKCDNPNCKFCKNRPNKPSEVKNEN